MSDFLDKAKDLAADHKDTVTGAVDKAADLADEKTGGQHRETIDKARDAATSAVDKIAGDDQA